MNRRGRGRRGVGVSKDRSSASPVGQGGYATRWGTLGGQTIVAQGVQRDEDDSRRVSRRRRACVREDAHHRGEVTRGRSIHGLTRQRSTSPTGSSGIAAGEEAHERACRGISRRKHDRVDAEFLDQRSDGCEPAGPPYRVPKAIDRLIEIYTPLKSLSGSHPRDGLDLAQARSLIEVSERAELADAFVGVHLLNLLRRLAPAGRRMGVDPRVLSSN